MHQTVLKQLKNKVTKKSHRGLSFDMWDDSAGSKLIGVHLVFPDEKYEKPEFNLLCMCPLEDETNSTGDNQIVTMEKYLQDVGLSFNDIHFLISDNTSVNPSISREVNVPLIGCKSHSLAIAVKNEFLEPFQDLVQKVNALCVKLRSCKFRGYLRQERCDLTPFVINGVRWSSVYTCLERYTQIRDFIVRTHPDLIDLVLAARQDAEVDGLLVHLKKLQSVTKHLQKSHVSLSEAHVLFDDLHALYPELDHLSPAHAIVPNKSFDSAVLKLIAGSDRDLSAVETRLMERFKETREDSDGEEHEERHDYAEAVLDRERKRRRISEAQRSEYIPLNWIPSTNNENERVFSKNKHVFF